MMRNILLWITILVLYGISSSANAQAPIRLVDGPDELSGRVEILINNTWLTVCDDKWDIEDANVVCRQLGHGTAKQADAHFGEGSGSFAFEGVTCYGDEQFLDNCSHEGLHNHDCVPGEEAGVVCNSNTYSAVRLVAGQSRYEGRVEVYHNGQWGTICDDGWGLPEASVVCRQLGLGPAFAATTEAHFGPGTGDILLDDVGCLGDEEQLGQCDHVGWGVTDCDHSEDAGVICNRTSGIEGEIRLVGGSFPNEGRVEIYHDGEWGTVCDDEFDIDDANVICRQLGFDSASLAKVGAHFGQGSGRILLDEVSCEGTEANLSDCSSNGWGINDCSHSEDAGVVCNVQDVVSTIRLVEGMSPSEGRVEVFYDGQWGTICDDSWDIVDANVACRQLGYKKAIAVKSAAYFGQGSGNILLDDIDCTGDEDKLHDCQSKGWAVHDCGHSEDAGVVCGNYSDIEIEVRLSDKGETGIIMGRVEVLHDGVWGTVCDDRFDLDDAQVICNQLGYPGADHFYKYGEGSTDPILLTNIECGGYEKNLGECAHSDWYPDNCLHSEDVGVVCNQNSGVKTDQLPLYVIIAISVGATIFILIIFTVIALICCYCCARKKNSSNLSTDDTADIIPPYRQSVPLEEFHGRHSFMFVNTPNGVQMVTPERPGSYVADSPPSTLLYQEGGTSNYLTPPPAVYKPPSSNGSIGKEETYQSLGVANGHRPYQELGASTPIRNQNGSIPRSIDHNGNHGNSTNSRASAFSQHTLTYEQPQPLNVPVQPTETTTSNYVGDADSEEYTYENPLPVSDETDNNVENKNKEVAEMLV